MILDEAYELGDEAMAALLPTLSARPNPQIWYTSTAGAADVVQLGRVRDRGRDAAVTRRWRSSSGRPRTGDDPADPGCWAQANPGLGIRITQEYVQRERAALSPDAFARERLSVGDYPVDGGAWDVIGQDAWQACAAQGLGL